MTTTQQVPKKFYNQKNSNSWKFNAPLKMLELSSSKLWQTKMNPDQKEASFRLSSFILIKMSLGHKKGPEVLVLRFWFIRDEWIQIFYDREIKIKATD